MSNEINPSYQKLLDGFTMKRTRDRKRQEEKGRGVEVNIMIVAYPDGHVHLYDGTKYPGPNEGTSDFPKLVAGLELLVERAVAEAKRIQADEKGPDQ